MYNFCHNIPDTVLDVLFGFITSMWVDFIYSSFQTALQKIWRWEIRRSRGPKSALRTSQTGRRKAIQPLLRWRRVTWPVLVLAQLLRSHHFTALIPSWISNFRIARRAHVCVCVCARARWLRNKLACRGLGTTTLNRKTCLQTKLSHPQFYGLRNSDFMSTCTFFILHSSAITI